MGVKRNLSCRVCEGRELTPFFDLGSQPLANALLAGIEDQEAHYPLELGRCADCGLVQLTHTIDPDMLFRHYLWVTGTSTIARSWADQLCHEIVARSSAPLGANAFVVEVASNDGTFLVPFQRRNWRVLGVDPAQNLAAFANSRGIPTRPEFFSAAYAARLRNEVGPAQIVFARHVLAHVGATRDFVHGLATMLTADGTLAVEVHYAKTILEELHYDSIYHEHLCYFTFHTLERLLSDFGLYPFDVMDGPISGGAIVVFARKERLPESSMLQQYRQAERSAAGLPLAAWQQFASRAALHRAQFRDLLNGAKRQGARIVGYGASARSSTLLNYAGIDSSTIGMVADQNPLKQGRFTAGTHIPIASPARVMDQKPDLVVLLAWNFADEIRRILETDFGYRGSYLIPLPHHPRIQKVEVARV